MVGLAMGGKSCWVSKWRIAKQVTIQGVDDITFLERLRDMARTGLTYVAPMDGGFQIHIITKNLVVNLVLHVEFRGVEPNSSDYERNLGWLVNNILGRVEDQGVLNMVSKVGIVGGFITTVACMGEKVDDWLGQFFIAVLGPGLELVGVDYTRG